jgi:hypothetical protein
MFPYLYPLCGLLWPSVARVFAEVAYISLGSAKISLDLRRSGSGIEEMYSILKN